MFCAVYRMIVKPGMTDQFVTAWTERTKQIYQHCGSLGSRLHGVSEQEFIAYAQWPSREQWINFSVPESVDQSYGNQMRESCALIETIYELEVIADLLTCEPYIKA